MRIDSARFRQLRAAWREQLSTRALPWIVLSAVSVLATVICGVSLMVVHRATRDQRPVQEAITHLDRRMSEANGARAAREQGAATNADFTHALPAAVDVRSLLVELERSSTNAVVALSDVQLVERPATTEQLARTDVTVSLRGSYPKLKIVVLDVLGRFPGVSLAQWRLRRVTRSADAEATLVLSMWGAAAPTVSGSSDPVAPRQGTR
jgi:hypothetical protein